MKAKDLNYDDIIKLYKETLKNKQSNELLFFFIIVDRIVQNIFITF
jgi:hypothetical protein